MIKSILFPDQEFETQELLFKALLDNETKILAQKKANVLTSFEKGQIGTFELLKFSEETKAALQLKEGYVYPIINTTRYYDSHADVHFDGIWNKSAKEQKGRISYVFDHSDKISDTIAWPEDVNILIKSIPWALVGKDYEGETEALIYEIKESAIENPFAVTIFQKKRKVQNSVRMRYVRVKMGINSDDPDYAKQKAYYDSKIELIVNREEVEKAGYFFGVEEAQIREEGSMVKRGSNDATSILYSDAADKSTSEKTDAPPEAPVKIEKKKSYYSALI